MQEENRMNRIIVMQMMLVLPFFAYSTEPIVKQFALDGQIIASIMFCSQDNGYSTYTKSKTADRYSELVELCKNACNTPQIPSGNIITAKKLLIIACGVRQEDIIILSPAMQSCIQQLHTIVEPNEEAIVSYVKDKDKNCRIELRGSGLHWCVAGIWKSFSRK